VTLDEAIAKVRALPCWQALGDIEPLEGGITNLNLKVRDKGRDWVVRLGDDIPEHGVMRFNELAISRAAARLGVSPAVHHAEPGVMVLEYIESRPLTAADLADRDTLAAALDLLQRVHRDLTREVSGPVLTFWVFHVIRDYARTLRRLESPHRDKLTSLLREAERLERTVGPIDPVLGHNDLLPANLLLSQGHVLGQAQQQGRKQGQRGARKQGKQQGQDKGRLWLIDWEYGGFNSALFDLGGLASNAELDADTEHWMLERCFERPPLPAYRAMKCASLLRETLWSMVSELTSSIDFDYAAYTADNLGRYRLALDSLHDAHD